MGGRSEAMSTTNSDLARKIASKEFDRLVKHYFRIEEQRNRKLRESIRASMKVTGADYRVVINV